MSVGLIWLNNNSLGFIQSFNLEFIGNRKGHVVLGCNSKNLKQHV